MSQDEENFKMCDVLDVANDIQFYCHWAIMCGALILLGACLYRIIVFRKVKNVAKYIPIVHLLLLVWGIVVVMDCLLNNLAYIQIKAQGDKSYSEYPEVLTQTFPRAVYLTDVMAMIILNSVLLLIPSFWVQTIIYYVKYTSESTSISVPTSINRAIRIYLVITRVTYIGYVVAQLIVPADSYELLQKLMRGFSSGQALLIVIFISYACNIFLRYFFQLAALTQEGADTWMKCKSYTLVATAFIRFALNFLWVLNIDLDGQFVQPCAKAANFYTYAVYVLLAYTLMHFLPVAIVLSMYAPKPTKGLLERQRTISEMTVDTFK